jgi:translation initiation factor 5
MDVRSTKIKIDCAACGHNSFIQTGHRLVTYILTDKKKQKDGGKAGKKDKKKKRNKKEAATENTEEKEESKEEEKQQEVEEVDDEWYTDTSKEAQKARKEAEFADMKTEEQNKKATEIEAILQMAKAENKTESPVTVLQVFLAGADRNASDIEAEVGRLKLSRGLSEDQALKVLLEAILDTSDGKKVVSQFKLQAPLFSRYTKDKHSSAVFIGCIEELVGVIEPKLINKTPMIFQALYETDILDESSLLSWADLPPESSWLVNKDVADKVRRKARPFIEWLRSAEEDSEEDEEEEEEE